MCNCDEKIHEGFEDRQERLALYRAMKSYDIDLSEDILDLIPDAEIDYGAPFWVQFEYLYFNHPQGPEVLENILWQVLAEEGEE